MIEKMSRNEWIAQHPQIQRWIESNPTTWERLPAFHIWPDANEIAGISDHQRTQLASATAGRIGILGGSPGTGKSFTLAQLIRHMLSAGTVSEYDIGIMAPTGKACVRINELLEKNEIPIRARTCHSHLGISSNSETGGWQFQHNANCPFHFRVIIIDEVSMLDLSLMLAIFRARPAGCHILLVGDVNQLPPVGSGAPLRDLIAARLPYGELREIKRATGGIVEACAAIRDQQPWRHLLLAKNSNIHCFECQTPEASIATLLAHLNTQRARGVDPVWDCQVLTAVNERSPLARTTLNEHLQREFNENPIVPGTVFRVGDKVVCLKNGFYRGYSQPGEDTQTNDRGEIYAANGEVGLVTAIEDNEIRIKLELPERYVAIPFKRETNPSGESGSAGYWDLAYALSVHKYQGSECPVVYTILDDYPGAQRVCDRSWIYTAISRARNQCHLVGRFETANAMCRTQSILKRKTFLKERIGLKRFEGVGI
jgi:exodeoxyribonuclease V alpha subunit